MARGQQAVQAQQKNAKKKEKERKAKANKGQPKTSGLPANAAKCKICMTVFKQLKKDKPKTLEALTAHMNKHKGREMGEAFPEYTPEALEAWANGGESKSSAPVVLTDWDAEQAVKTFPKDERIAAIATAGGKPVWATLGWKARLEILQPTEKVYAADKEVKSKKKATHKRH